MRILLVDDEQELVSALAERLAFRGIQADWVCDAESAIRKVRADHYDVAVLDVRMPGISGIDLKKRLAEENPELRFIFMTGHGSLADFQTGSAEAGSDFYLAKPVKLELLIEKLQTVIGNKKEQK
ncbi:MAG: response regulator [Desulfobacterales bacterium]